MNPALPQHAVDEPPCAIRIRLPDGSERSFAQPVTGAELAAAIGPGLAKAAAVMEVSVGEVDGELFDLGRELPDGASVRFIRYQDEAALPVIRHDCAHVMAEAVQDLYPGTQITIGPAIEDGFYYDFARKEPFTPEDLRRIEARMAEIIDARPADRARGVEPRRCPRGASRHGRELQGSSCVDDIPAGRGGLGLPPGRLARSVPRAASALDRQDRQGVQADQARRRLLAGRPPQPACCSASTAPPGANKKELDAYLHRLEEAEKRDHRRHRQRDGPVPPPGRGRGHRSSGTPRAGRSIACWRPICAAGSRRPAMSRSRRRSSSTARSGRLSGHWEKFGEHMFVARGRGDEDAARAEADELPRPHPDLQPGPQELSRPAAAHGRVRLLPPQRAVGRAARHHAGARVHPGRRPHLLHRGPDRRPRSSASATCCDSIYRDLGFADVRVNFADRPEVRAGEDAIWDRAERALRAAVRGGRARDQAESRRGRVLRAQARIRAARRDRPRLAVRHAAGRFRAARAAGRELCRRGRPEAPAGDAAPRHPRLVRALHRHPDRALCRQVSALAGAGAGGGRHHRQRCRRLCAGGRRRRWPRRGCAPSSTCATRRSTTRFASTAWPKCPSCCIRGPQRGRAAHGHDAPPGRGEAGEPCA